MNLLYIRIDLDSAFYTMKLSILSFFFILSFFNINSQNTIAIQSFENSGDNWLPLNFSTPPCSNNNDIWNYSTGLSGINPSDGNQFWGIQDLDGGCGGSGFETISLPNINVASFSDVIFSFDYNAVNFDNGEDLKYEIFYDNISQGEVIVVNGVRGRGDNTNGWKTETVPIPEFVTNVRVNLSAKCNRGNERAGFDNVKLAEASFDSCAGAASLIVYDIGASSGNETSADTSTATPSSMSLTSCDSYTSNENLDLFYTFTVPTGVNSVNVLTSGSNGNTINVAVWDSCNGNEIICQNNNSSLHRLDGLSSGSTYILQVWHDDFNAGPFTIALETSPPPPANSDCFSATSLVVGNSNSENIITGTNVDASNSGALPTPSCARYNGNDVWYTAQIPPSGIITVETLNAGSNIDTGLAIYTGTCNNLTQIACDDDSGPGLYSTINLTGYPNTTVYIRVWAYANNSSGDFNIVAYSPLCPFTTSWTGVWSNGTPNSYTSAIINNNYDTSVEGSFESCNCQINNITVNIRANNYITVYNDLTVNGTLEVNHESSLVMINDDGIVSVSGTLNVHKSSAPYNQYDYTYWASPVANETIGSALTTSVANRIYRFDPSIYNELTTNGWAAVGSSWVMDPGTGYIAMGPITGTFPQTQDVIFNGVVNNGLIQVPIILSADDSKEYEDWNLIGNPYPSGIDADLLLRNSLNTDVVGGTVYLWTHNTERNTNQGEQDYNSNDYATYTFGTGGVAATSGGERPTGIIASGQSFFIDGVTNGNITFNNSMRVNSGNDQFFRSPETKNYQNEEDKIWLNLYTESGAFNQLLIGFIEGATDEIDRSYDGLKFGGGWVSFYSIAEGKNLAIQGKKPLNEQEFVQLGFSSFVDEGEILKIGIAKAEGKINEEEFEIILKDKLLNSLHNLNEKEYNFTINDKGVFNDRFELIIRNSSVLDIENINEIINDKLVINNVNRQLTISTLNNSIISNFKAYNILGKLIIDESPNKGLFHVNAQHIDNGTILILRATLENNQTLIKKIILY